MKLEPLKDKGMLLIDTFADNNQFLGYSRIKVKSAIDWLKERKLGNKLNPFDFEGKEMIVFYKEDFDESFEGVK